MHVSQARELTVLHALLCCANTGRIPASESIMFYGIGSGSYASFQNASFVPMFVPKFKNSAAQQAAQAVCGTNLQCLLDYAATNNPKFANATRNTDKAVASANKMFGR